MRIGGQLNGFHLMFFPTEQAALPAGALGICRGGNGQQRFCHGMHTRAIGLDAVKRPCGGKAFNLTPIEQARVDAIGKIIQRFERALGHPFGNDLFHRAFTNAFERTQSIAHGKRVFLNGLHLKVGATMVDARRKAGHAQTAHIIHEDGELFGVGNIKAHRRSKEICRIMRFQPRCLIGEQRVSRRVGFVEAIACKFIN